MSVPTVVSLCVGISDLGEVSSVEAFAEIQDIGQAVARLGAFDESLPSILRTSLGDWREPITWRPEVFTDLAARSDLYVSLGFNPAITAFPSRAFEDSPRDGAERPEAAEQANRRLSRRRGRGFPWRGFRQWWRRDGGAGDRDLRE